jgi:hypothetical protein
MRHARSLWGAVAGQSAVGAQHASHFTTLPKLPRPAQGVFMLENQFSMPSRVPGSHSCTESGRASGCTRTAALPLS